MKLKLFLQVSVIALTATSILPSEVTASARNVLANQGIKTTNPATIKALASSKTMTQEYVKQALPAGVTADAYVAARTANAATPIADIIAANAGGIRLKTLVPAPNANQIAMAARLVNDFGKPNFTADELNTAVALDIVLRPLTQDQFEAGMYLRTAHHGGAPIPVADITALQVAAIISAKAVSAEVQKEVAWFIQDAVTAGGHGAATIPNRVAKVTDINALAGASQEFEIVWVKNPPVALDAGAAARVVNNKFTVADGNVAAIRHAENDLVCFTNLGDDDPNVTFVTPKQH